MTLEGKNSKSSLFTSLVWSINFIRWLTLKNGADYGLSNGSICICIQNYTEVNLYKLYSKLLKPKKKVK